MDHRDHPMPVLSPGPSGSAGALSTYQPGPTTPAAPKPKVGFWWPMRGRWKVTALCASAGAVLLGLLGWWTATVRYEAVGRVDTQLLATGYPGERPGDPEMIRGVLQREAEQLERLGGAFGAHDAQLTATPRPPTGLTLRATADDPAAADHALTRALQQYQQKTALNDEVALAAQAREKLDALNALLSQRDAVQQQIDTLSWTQDGVALPALLEQRQRELAQRSAKLAEITQWLGQLRGVAVSRQTALVVLAESDPKVAELLIERASLVVKMLAGLVGESTQATRSQQQRWAALNDQIDAIADDTRVMPAAWVGAPHDEHRLVAIRLGELTRQQQQTQEQVDRLTEELTQLGDRHRMLNERRDAWRKLDTQVQTARSAFAAVADRPALVLKFLGATAEPAGVAPVIDNRLPRTVLGALSGALLGLLGVMAVAWTDTKVRRPDPEPWTQRDAPLVGVVPEVYTEQPGDDATLGEAARRKMQEDLSRLADAVHAIRAVVEAQLGSDTAKMICVTSAGPGSGKTSLTVGLASSLVMGGMKVLVVDAALTDRVAKAARDNDSGDKKSGGTSGGASGGASGGGGEGGAQTLDEVMVGMEFLDAEDRDLLAFPDEEPVGLGAYLHGTPLEQAEIRTRIPGLGLLSGVGVRAGDSGRLSSTFFRRLGLEASQRYDVVLLDTGAVPRCVEALFVAGASDGVLLVVGRRESRRAVDVALQRLRLVGARILGTVFNRDQASPDAKTATGTGATIDPSWRDQGSGMFAAAVRTHSGQSSTFEPAKGQTAMFNSGRPPTDEATNAGSADNAASRAGAGTGASTSTRTDTGTGTGTGIGMGTGIAAAAGLAGASAAAANASNASAAGSSVGMGPIDFGADAPPRRPNPAQSKTTSQPIGSTKRRAEDRSPDDAGNLTPEDLAHLDALASAPGTPGTPGISGTPSHAEILDGLDDLNVPDTLADPGHLADLEDLSDATAAGSEPVYLENNVIEELLDGGAGGASGLEDLGDALPDLSGDEDGSFIDRYIDAVLDAADDSQAGAPGASGASGASGVSVEGVEENTNGAHAPGKPAESVTPASPSDP